MADEPEKLIAGLEVAEWVSAASFILFLASFLLISRFHEHRQTSQLPMDVMQEEQFLDVTIMGEVLKPGTFQVSLGTRLGDVIKKSVPKRFADLRPLDLDCPVASSLEIAIAPLKEISILVEGAVPERIELTLPVGSRICDLRSKIRFTADADAKFLKRRRLLKDREMLVVPKVPEGRLLEGP